MTTQTSPETGGAKILTARHAPMPMDLVTAGNKQRTAVTTQPLHLSLMTAAPLALEWLSLLNVPTTQMPVHQLEEVMILVMPVMEVTTHPTLEVPTTAKTCGLTALTPTSLEKAAVVSSSGAMALFLPPIAALLVPIEMLQDSVEKSLLALPKIGKQAALRLLVSRAVMVASSVMALPTGIGAAYLARMSMSVTLRVTGGHLAPRWLITKAVMVAFGMTAQPTGMNAVNHAMMSKLVSCETFEPATNRQELQDS